MTTKAATKATKKPGTAAAPKGTALVNMQDAIKKELESLQSRTGSPGGDEIRVTQDKQFKLPDGTEHPGPLRLVIVDFVTGRYFYDRPFDQKNPCPPACMALSVQPTTMVPPKDVPDRQSDNCTGCPLNEWGSAGDGKACKESRVLAVIPEDADATTEVSVLKVSPTALKAFDSYVRSLANALGKAPFQVVTEVSFDPNLKYGSLRFGNPEPASDDLVDTAFSLREAARQRILTYPDLSGYTPPSKGKAPARGRR